LEKYEVLTVNIGIPRALLYYWYGKQWEDFWRDCGCEVTVSPPTDRRILTDGVEAAIDEICLPVKIFLGHLRYLAPQVDRIMLPHLIRVERDSYICPKFMGLPDVVQHTLPELQGKLLPVTVNLNQTDMGQSLKNSATQLGLKPRGVRLKKFPEDGPDFSLPTLNNKSSHPTLRVSEHSLTIGLLGHAYCLYDSCFNLNLLERLAAYKVKLVTPEMIPAAFRGVGSARLPKKLFWTMGRSQMDALEWMLNGTAVDGFIHVAPFACGLEAFIGDLLERRIRNARKPLLKLNFEEHSGEAGMITRLEAFIDLVKYHMKAC
jgi:predicted nucleotide-binding protein (sugar kinase/HSP70/actin superfamily)